MMAGDVVESRQITHAASDVAMFGVAYDGLSIAYISDGRLWLQPIHTEDAEALTPLSATLFFNSPVYSPDGRYIAYADNGLWLYDMAARQTRQLLADVPIDPMGTNMSAYRVYRPERFITDAQGVPVRLIVDIGVWEWSSEGVYDLASGELQELSGYLHTALLPLSSGRVFIYGNGGVSGDPALRIAQSLDNINRATRVVGFGDITAETLFADQAVEIAPEVVRVVGATLYNLNVGIYGFYFDYNLVSGAGPVRFIKLSDDSMSNVFMGPLSPDGDIWAVYEDALWTDTGGVYGRLKLLDLATGEPIAAHLPPTVGVFRWQP